MITISVVIASHNEGENLIHTVDSLLYTLPSDSELIIVDDCSTDGSTSALQGYEDLLIHNSTVRLGTSRARDFGARQAQGKIIVFCDAHIEVSSGWPAAIVTALQDPSVGAVGPAICDMFDRNSKGYGLWYIDAGLNFTWGERQAEMPYPVPVLSAAFMAMRRECYLNVGGFDPGMLLYGMEDPELDLRLWTYGYRLLVLPDVEAAHLYRSEHPYLQWETMLHNMLRFGMIHFGTERFRKLVESITQQELFPSALAQVIASDVWVRRAEVQQLRIYDDDWYFSRFGMEF